MKKLTQFFQPPLTPPIFDSIYIIVRISSSQNEFPHRVNFYCCLHVWFHPMTNENSFAPDEMLTYKSLIFHPGKTVYMSRFTPGLACRPGVSQWVYRI